MATVHLPKSTWVDLGSTPLSIQRTTNTQLWIDFSPNTPDDSIKGKNVINNDMITNCYPEVGDKIFVMSPFDDADITTRPT